MSMISQTEMDRLRLQELAESIIEAAKVIGPPVSLFEIAKAFGVPIRYDQNLDCRARLQGTPSAPIIVLGPNERPERFQSAVGHEIGELLKPEICHLLCRIVGRPTIDYHCQTLAAYLACPSRWFAGDCLRLNGNLFELKHIYSTASYEMIARRIVEVMGDPARCWIVDQGWWRLGESNAKWPRTPIDIEYDVRRFANRSGDVIERTKDGFCSVAWPIHERGRRWKREIVISRALCMETEIESGFADCW